MVQAFAVFADDPTTMNIKTTESFITAKLVPHYAGRGLSLSLLIHEISLLHLKHLHLAVLYMAKLNLT